MSEERGKRDSHSEEPEDFSESDDVAAGSEVSASAADESKSPAADAVSLAKPTGKRSARRVRETVPATSSAVSASATKTARRSGKDKVEKRPNIFKRLIKFFREVIAELRKVIWPNRKQMVTYTAVVLVFVTFMVAYISGLDVAFGRGVDWLFN